MKPDHSTHGQVHRPSKNRNTWTKDTKTKTCRCRICGDRVKDWSWKCSECGKHICSVCCQEDASEQTFSLRAAKDMYEKGCWCKRFPSGMNPKLTALKRATKPPKQEEQMQKDLEAKRKAAATSASKKAAAVAAAAGNDNFGEGPSRRPGTRPQVESDDERESSESEETNDMSSDVPSSMQSRQRGRALAGVDRAGQESDGNVSDFELPEPEYPELSSRSSGESGKRVKGKRRVIDESDEESDEGRRMLKRRPVRKPEAKKTNGPSSRKGKDKTADVNYLPPSFVDPHKRKNDKKKRNADAAQLDSDGVQETPSKTPRKTKKVEEKKPNPLKNGHTMIVGAGIVGLFTAYELATHCTNEKLGHKVTVVEIRDGSCQLASGQCAGFLTARGISKNKDWIPFVSEAQKAWDEIIRKVKPDLIGFVEEETFFAQDVGDADDEGEQMPSWFRPGPIHQVREDEMVMGRVDPRLVTKWLYRQCKALGVGFYFGREMQAVEPIRDDNGYRASFGNPRQPLGKPMIMECTQMVLAAGPYTTSIARNHFNEGQKTGLENVHQQYLRIDIPHNHTDRRSAAAALTIGTTDKWSAGTMTMLVRPGSSLIEISAPQKRSENCGIDSEYALSPQSVDEMPLKRLAAPYLGIKREEQVEVADGGAATVSMAQGDRPYVGLLQMRNDSSQRVFEMPDVWLSYGFGRYGTTLAPGAARMLVRKIVNQK